MADLLLPALAATFSWWFLTGLILLLDRLPRRTFPVSLGAATAAAAFAGALLVHAAHREDAAAAYLGFAAALVLWSWHEMAFLMGVLTGPRRSPCPPGARGTRRFWLATQTVLHHEIALAATAAALVALTWGAPNQTGAATFALLFFARILAKLNLYFGVPNTAEEFLPPHLAYLKTYFRRAPPTLLLPASIAMLAAAAFWIGAGALRPEASLAASAGGLLILTLAILACVEHLAMVVPLPDAALWRWALSQRR